MAVALPLRALAPAKVNLCLYVGERRDHGLHAICSLFQSVTLADELVMQTAQADGDELICAGVSGPNLAAEALARFRERFGWRDPAVRITIEKRIPVAAGLGGGSADAAAVLRLALAASGIEAAADELRALATSLGADVPSQLWPGAHLVTGAGERVEPIALPLAPALVVLFGVGRLATADVYAHADRLSLPPRDLDALAGELRAATSQAMAPAELEPLLHNDLEPATLALEPAAGRALELLREAGALRAIVSGSGPAALGLFADGYEARQAARELVSSWPGDAIACGPADAAYAAPGPVATAS